jgi:DNA sulfur modification protein DndB
LESSHWAMIIAQFPEWEQVGQGRLNAATVRSDFIHASGLVLDALGRIGNTLIRDTVDPDAWQKTLAALTKIDWRRRNAELWEGRATSGGRLTKSHAHVLLTKAAIRHALGMPLPPDERWLDEDFTARAKRAQSR